MPATRHPPDRLCRSPGGWPRPSRACSGRDPRLAALGQMCTNRIHGRPGSVDQQTHSRIPGKRVWPRSTACSSAHSLAPMRWQDCRNLGCGGGDRVQQTVGGKRRQTFCGTSPSSHASDFGWDRPETALGKYSPNPAGAKSAFTAARRNGRPSSETGENVKSSLSPRKCSRTRGHPRAGRRPMRGVNYFWRAADSKKRAVEP